MTRVLKHTLFERNVFETFRKVWFALVLSGNGNLCTDSRSECVNSYRPNFIAVVAPPFLLQYQEPYHLLTTLESGFVSLVTIMSRRNQETVLERDKYFAGTCAKPQKKDIWILVNDGSRCNLIQTLFLPLKFLEFARCFSAKEHKSRL